MKEMGEKIALFAAAFLYYTHMVFYWIIHPSLLDGNIESSKVNNSSEEGE